MSIPIPNTLTIIIRTKVRDNNVIKYVPTMTIPNISGGSNNVVHFEPIVKLDNATINMLPPNYPPSQIFSQFFNENQFYGLLHRTLEKMKQKINKNKPLIEQLSDATKNGIISSNIRTTLNTLFKTGNIFYLDRQPFTIHSYHWNDNDWIIQSKFFEKNILKKNINDVLGRSSTASPYSSASAIPVAEVVQDNLGRGRIKTNRTAYMELLKQQQEKRETEQRKLADKELSNLKKKNPDVLHGLANEENSVFYPFLNPDQDKKGSKVSNVGKGRTGVKNAGLSTLEHSEDNPVIMSINFKKMVGEDYVYEPTMNLYSSTTNSIECDPLSLSLFYQEDRDFSIERKKSLPMEDRYKKFSVQTGTFIQAQQEFYSKFDATLTLCDQITQNVEIISKFMTVNKSFETIVMNPGKKQTLFDAITRSNETKQKFIDSYIQCILLFNKMKKEETEYLNSMFAVYEMLVQLQKNEIKKTKMPSNEMIVKLNVLQSDLNIIKAISQLKQSTNLEEIQQGLEVIKRRRLNTREEGEKYYTYPEILVMEKIQFDYCVLFLLQQKELQSKNVWEIYKIGSDQIYNGVKKLFQTTLAKTIALKTRFQQRYTPKEIQDVSQIATTTNTSNQTNMLSFTSNQASQKTPIRKEYNELQQQYAECYKYITLLMQVHIIQIARDIAFLNVSNNLSQIEIKKYEKMREYFVSLLQIKKRTNDVSLIVPKLSPAFNMKGGASLFDSTDFSNDTIENIETQVKMLTDEISHNEGDIQTTNISLIDLKKKNDEEIDAISSNITQLAIQTACDTITSPSPYKGYNKEETKLVQEWMRNEIGNLLPELLQETSTEEIIDFVNSVKIYRIGDGSSFLATMTSAMNYELLVQNATTNYAKYETNGQYDLERIKDDLLDENNEDSRKRLEEVFKINIFVVNENKRYAINFVKSFPHPYTLFLWKNSSNTFDIVFAENHFLFQFADNFLKWIVLKQTMEEQLKMENLLKQRVAKQNVNDVSLKKIQMGNLIRESIQNKKQKEDQKTKQRLLLNPQIEKTRKDDENESILDALSGPPTAPQYGGATTLLTYYVMIDLDLYPGKDGIPYDKSLVIGCQNKYEEIRHAWADLFKLEYKPLSLYHTAYDKKKENERKSNISRYTRKQPTNYYGNKTRRLYG